MRTLVLVFALVAPLACRAADHDDESEKAAPATSSSAPNVVHLSEQAVATAKLAVSTAGSGTVATTLTLPGEVALDADSVVRVSPKVPGVATAVNAQVGSVVKKGSILAVLDSREFASLEADALAASTRLKLAQSNYDREEKLRKDKINAEKDFIAAQKELDLARVEYDLAKRKLDAVSRGGPKGHGYAVIAPIDGTVVDKHIGLGEVLNDQSTIFTVADLRRVWITFAVYPKDLPSVKIGEPATIRTEVLDKPIAGTISFVGPIVSETTQAAVARIVIEAPPDRLRPGLFTTVDVAVNRTGAPVVVLDEAVQNIEQRTVVFVETAPRTFVARDVVTGRHGISESGAEIVEIVRGLAAGDRYVAQNSFILKAELLKSSTPDPD